MLQFDLCENRNKFNITIGAILIGGDSRRMGVNKANIELNGISLLDRSIAILKPEVEDLFIIGKEDDSVVGLSAVDASRIARYSVGLIDFNYVIIFTKNTI